MNPHINHINTVSNIIKRKEFDKLLSFCCFRIEILIDQIYQLLDANDNILSHFIINCADLEFAEPIGKNKFIHYICRRENTTKELFSCLLSRNVNLESSDNMGFRPIHMAFCFLKYDSIKLLIDRGVSMKKTKIHNMGPLDMMFYSSVLTPREKSFLTLLVKNTR